MNRKLLLYTLILALLTSCSGTPATPTASLVPSATATALPTGTPVSTLTPTNTPEPSATATSTPEPTATLTPTLIPTPELPLGPDDSLPQPLLQISPDNVFSLTELARYGTARVYNTVFSADRKCIFALTGEGVKAYQTNTMERLAWFKELGPIVNEWGSSTWMFSSSRDGQRFSLLTSGNHAQVYDLSEGLVYSTTLPAFWSPWVTLSMDGNHLAIPQIGEDEWAMRWQLIDIADGSVIADGIGMNARFSPAGTYLVGDASDTLYLYRTSDWQQQTQIGLRAGGKTAKDWSFSPDDRYLAVVMDDSVTVWEVETRQRVRQFNPITGAGAEVSRAFFSEDSSQMAVVEYIDRVSSNLLIWNIADGSLITNQTTQEAGIYDFDQVLLDSDGLHGYSVPRESDGSGYQAPQWTGWQMAFDLTDTSLSVVDLTGWDEINSNYINTACTFTFSSPVESHCQKINGSLGVTSDGLGNFYSLWQGEGSDVSLYRGLEQSGTPLLTFSTGGFYIRMLGVSPDQRLLVYSLGTGESTLQVREIATGNMIFTEDTTGRIEKLRFSADGTRLAATMISSDISHPQILVYDATQNAVLYRLPAQEMMRGDSAVLSPDGLRLAYRFERGDALRWSGIQVWDPLHQRQLANWEGNVQALGNPMAFSPDGKLLATVDSTGTVFLLDAESGIVLHQWKAHADAVLNLAFSPDGTLLATSGTDGFLRLWGIFP